MGEHKHKCPICKKLRKCNDETCEEIDWEWMCDDCWEKENELEEV